MKSQPEESDFVAYVVETYSSLYWKFLFKF